MTKRKVIKILVALLICLLCAVSLISQIKLEKERDRNIVVCTLNSDLKEYVIERCESSTTPQEVIKACSKLACERLSFTAKNDIPKGRVNCVGYAQLTSAIINYAFQIKKFPYKAKPVVGKVYLFGISLNNLAQKILPPKYRPFFKDHDFVEIDLGNQTVFVDSSLQDLTGYGYYQTKIVN